MVMELGSAVVSPAAPKRRSARSGGRPLGESRTQELLARLNAVAILLIVVDAVAWLGGSLLIGPGWAWAGIAGLMLFSARASSRLYRRRLWLSWFQDLPRSAIATATAFALVTCATMITDQPEPTTVAVQQVVLAFAASSEAARLGVFILGRWGRRRFGRCDRTIVVGAGKVGIDLVRTMIDHPEFGLRPVGFVDSDAVLDRADLPVDLLDEDLATAITRLRVGTVILAFSHAKGAAVVDAAITAHRLGCVTLVVPRMYELCQDGPDIDRLRSYPLVRLGTAPTTRPSWWIKRSIDVVLAAIGLVVTAPVIAVCALAVWLESGFPLVFRQVRVGMDGHMFMLYKLRSVRQGDEDDSQTTWSMVGDARVGPVGRVLRRTSLDELPQLWNILRGDMSIVGPRPERPTFVREFSDIHDLYWARHRVPAGLTGLAQVHGLRGDTSIADRSRYDNYYIANWSLWLDVKILLLTVGELVCRRNR